MTAPGRRRSAGTHDPLESLPVLATADAEQVVERLAAVLRAFRDSVQPRLQAQQDLVRSTEPASRADATLAALLAIGDEVTDLCARLRDIQHQILMRPDEVALREHAVGLLAQLGVLTRLSGRLTDSPRSGTAGAPNDDVASAAAGSAKQPAPPRPPRPRGTASPGTSQHSPSGRQPAGAC